MTTMTKPIAIPINARFSINAAMRRQLLLPFFMEFSSIEMAMNRMTMHAATTNNPDISLTLHSKRISKLNQYYYTL